LFLAPLLCVYRRAIYKHVLTNGTTAQQLVPFYDAGQIIDDLVVDVDHQMLYWTAFDAGLIGSLNLSQVNATHDVIVSNTLRPRAIAIDSRNGSANLVCPICL